MCFVDVRPDRSGWSTIVVARANIAVASVSNQTQLSCVVSCHANEHFATVHVFEDTSNVRSRHLTQVVFGNARYFLQLSI